MKMGTKNDQQEKKDYIVYFAFFLALLTLALVLFFIIRACFYHCFSFKKVFYKFENFSFYGIVKQIDVKDERLKTCIYDLLKLDYNQSLKKEQIENVTSLKCVGYNISDISSLQYFSNLKELDLRQNKISEIEPLSKLVSLRKLHLGWNKIYNLKPLANLKNLEELYLNNNLIKDISVLSNLVFLTTLDISNNKIEDIAPLIYLPFLKKLNISYNPIKTSHKFYETLTECVKIQELGIAGLPIDKIKEKNFLKYLVLLKTLYLDPMQIKEVLPLFDSHQNVRIYVLYDKKFSDFYSIKQLASQICKCRRIQKSNLQVCKCFQQMKMQ